MEKQLGGATLEEGEAKHANALRFRTLQRYNSILDLCRLMVVLIYWKDCGLHVFSHAIKNRIACDDMFELHVFSHATIVYDCRLD